MRNRRRCFSLAVMSVFAQIISGLSAAAWAQGQPITFSALTDIPYGSSEYALMRQYVAEHNRYSPSAFIIHLGDLLNGTCDESKYANVAEIMKGFAVPAYIVVGDNEYNDCANSVLALSEWRKYFANFEQNFCGAPLTEHQSARPENLAFTQNGVLFVGLNLVGGAVHDQNEWNARLQEDANWVSQQLQAKVSQVRAAVIFAHAGPEGSTNNRVLFFSQFRSAAATFAKPVLFMQGNALVYKLDQPWPESNLSRLVAPRGNTEPPLEITVTMASNPQQAFTVKRRPWGATPFNMPPCVNAGVDQTVAANIPITLPGAATDDGDPAGGALTTTWNQVSGPGTTIFDNANAPTTTASFSATGTYVLSLLANDGQLFKSDEVTIVVQGQVIAPTISISDLSVNEGNSGSGDVLFVATLTNPNGLSSTVVCQVVDGTASRNSDYTVISGIGTMTFKNGVTTQRVRVTINGDVIDEQQDETFFVNLSNATNAVIADHQAVGTIINDDGPPPPIAPGNLTANVTGTSIISLVWNDNSADEDGFKIERKISGGNFSELATVGSGVTAFNDTGVIVGVSYVYRIRAFRATINSDYSNEATAIIPKPGTPGNLTASATGAASIALSWNDNSTDEDGFKIERKISGGSFSEIATVGSGVTSFNDGDVSIGVSYVYRIRAYRATINSDYSNEATAIIPKPGTPGNLTASGAASIALSWNDNSTDEDGFKIERKISGGSFSEIATVGGGIASFNDAGVSVGVSYVYRVRAFRATINSDYSNEATAVIPPPNAPGNLTANATGTSTISLSWNDNAADENGFKIERKTGVGAFSEIATAGVNIVSYNDNGLSAGTTYVYRVRAYTGAVFSSYSNETTATTIAGNVNLARNRPVTASSTDSDPTKLAASAVDGDVTTYWRSGVVSTGAPIGWLSVDLGATMTVGKVVVNWKENYFAETLSIQVSSNNSTWTAIHGATGSPGVQTFNFAPTSARYVRLYFTKNNKSNYRINEFEVYAGSGATAKSSETRLTEAETAVPEEFILEQNYPNPVSASGSAGYSRTQISFSLLSRLAESRVTIKVFTTNGAEVATLADGRYSAGRHTVAFTARNLPSGNYFYVLQAGSARRVRWLTLLKQKSEVRGLSWQKTECQASA